MSDDKKLESLKSLQLEIKSKLNLLATKKAYEDEKNRQKILKAIISAGGQK